MPFETARISERRLLGSNDETARYLAHLPFTREIAAAGVVGEALASSLAEARVPATVMLEARKALAEQLWLANGEAAGSAALRLPLDVINVSSGFGLRPDPLDKPGPPMGPLADPAPVAAAAAPEPPPPPKEEPLPPPRRPTWAVSLPSAARAMSSTPAVPISIAVAPSLSPHPRWPRRPSRRRSRRRRLHPRRPSLGSSCMTASTSSR